MARMKPESQAADSARPLGDPVKRALDLAIGIPAFILAAPVLCAVAAAVALTMGRPVLFSQLRPGRGGKLFRIFKFRTMNVMPDELQEGVPDKGRITWLGWFLRETSIDELPELWNLARGEMSLVGPRPLLRRYYPYFTERERLRFKVRPGITGWAQVHGRSNLPWDERLEMDAWYVENRSLRLDLKILVLTFVKVLQRRDVHVCRSEALKYDLDVERRMKGKGGDTHDW